MWQRRKLLHLRRRQFQSLGVRTAPKVVPKSGSPAPPTAKTTPSQPALTESNELTSTMSVELTTARAETDALLEAIKEVSTSVEDVEGQEGTSKLIKVMLLGLKAQIHFSGSQY